MKIGARLWAASAVLVLVPLVLILLGGPLDARFGLSGRYYANQDWQGDAVGRIDSEITTRALKPAPLEAESFSARWDGYLRVDRAGGYIFQLLSDDGAWLEIDGRVVIDNGGSHSPVLKEETIHLAEGLHVIGVTFFQGAGSWRLDLRWAPEGESPKPLAAPWLMNTPMDGWQYTAARGLRAALPYIPFLWLAAAFLLLLGFALPVFERLHLTGPLRDRALHAVILLSFGLNAVGIWWGIGWRWAPDEILPSQVLEGIENKFSNGWSGPYPPLQFYILGLAYVPFLAAQGMLDAPVAFPLHLVNRLVSLLMAAGILAACYLCGRTLSGRIAGLTAATITALLLPFAYYAKIGNLDVPYLFWFCWAMLFYIRIILSGDVAAYPWFALTVAFAIATKDQAFGYFVAPCIHVVVLHYRRLAAVSETPLIGVLRDGVVPRAAIVGVVTLIAAYNLPFNWSGFLDHIAVLRINGGDKYRMVAATLDGQFTLLKYTLSQVRFAFGWPALLFVCVALLHAMRTPPLRTTLWLLLPVASYYCFFIAPTSILFDRFVIGICILLTIIAGCAVEDWMRSGVLVRRAAAWCLSAVCLYSAARVIALDALMVTDSRFHVEEWVAAHVPLDAGIASVGPQSMLPRIYWDLTVALTTQDPLPPAAHYVVLNASYAQRFDSSSLEGATYDRVRNGDAYSLVLRHRMSIWPPLSRDPVFTDAAENWFTNLDKINPLIEVYKRNDGGPASVVSMNQRNVISRVHYVPRSER